MTDPALIVTRLISLVMVPLLLCSPLVFVLCVRVRVREEADRATARARTMALALATLGALAFWLGLLLVSVNLRLPSLENASQWCWTLFFPLFFVLGMPALRARNPAWGSLHSEGPGAVRTASLVSRAHRNPVTRWHWACVGIVGLGLVAAIAARGWLEPFADDAEKVRWMTYLGCAVLAIGLSFIIQPIAIRSALQEPEPLDAHGSRQLVRMYDEYREARIRGLFWLLGAALPIFLAGCMAIATWWPSNGGVVGWVGGLGGSLLGIGGAWFGVAMSLRRVRITEFKMTLDQRGAQEAQRGTSSPVGAQTPRTMSPGQA